MKLILKNKKLKEAELKTSSKLVQSGYQGIVMRVMMGHRSGSASINVPLKELLYEKSKPLVVGAILQHYGNVQHKKLRSNKELMDNWIPEERTFKKEFVDQMMQQTFPLAITYGSSNLQALGATGMTSINNVVVPIIMINPEKHQTQDRMLTTIRHEAQHVTQFFGNVCLYHYELLKRANFDFTKIEEPDYSANEIGQQTNNKVKLVKLVGKGKEKTFAPSQTVPPDPYDFATEQEYEKAMEAFSVKYFSDDVEFETWLSDLSTYAIDYAFSTAFSPEDLIGAYLKTKFPTFAGSLMTEDVKAIKALKAAAEEIGVPYERLRTNIKKSQSLSQLAQGLAKLVTSSEPVMQAIAADYGNKAIVYALKAFPKIRPREFQRDFVAHLEQKLKSAVEYNYPFLKTL
jgi:hypothetical protein